jgi:hypothetical protein
MRRGDFSRSFMSPLSNRRSDRYGGVAENRLRFSREIVEEVRRVDELSGGDDRPDGDALARHRSNRRSPAPS